MRSLRFGLFGLLMWAVAAAATGQAPNSSPTIAERRAVEEFTARFLTSFERLDMPAFIACFAEDATVFFPTPEPPERFSGRNAVQNHFQKVFDGIRSHAPSGPPYHRLNPEDEDVQLLSPDVAVVSFHLRNSERLARRTLVLKKAGGKWLIAHLHASNVALN
jgi:ketosteroid isomerase-like protein